MITIYAFGSLPPVAIGLSRDLRALWAAEETGLSYKIHPIDAMRGEQRQPDFLKISPFGKLPVIEDDGLAVIESAAIVFHMAEKAGKLLPKDAKGRSQATQWAFAALNTVEPDLANLIGLDLVHKDKAWAKERRPELVENIRGRLTQVERHLTDRPYLLGDDFTAPDILMSTVLRQIQHTDILDDFPKVADYKAGCEARPAWKKLYDAYERRLAA
jgi:glutathione S-transferase